MIRRVLLAVAAGAILATVCPAGSLPREGPPDMHLYPPPADAKQDLHQAQVQAVKEHKRVLVVFGANWCGDCHALNAAFHSAELAPIVDSDYVVVHVNIGDEGRDNWDLAERVGVNLRKGIPALAVLEPNGRVVMAQKNGEFESSERISMEDVRTFLEKYKPAR